MRKIIIFGTGIVADCVSFYFENDEKFQIIAYCCDSEHIKEPTFRGKPVIAFDEINKIYPPNSYSMFIAIGYHKLNEFRKKKFLQALDMGYQLESYIGSNVIGKFKIGRNSFVLDGTVIQPYVTIGDNSFIWSGSMIGHHVEIANHCWITGSANIGGLSKINDECFLGLNATISNNVIIGKRSLLGACSFVNKNLSEGSVVIEPGSNLFRLNSDNFLKISNSF